MFMDRILSYGLELGKKPIRSTRQNACRTPLTAAPVAPVLSTYRFAMLEK